MYESLILVHLHSRTTNLSFNEIWFSCVLFNAIYEISSMAHSNNIIIDNENDRIEYLNDRAL